MIEASFILWRVLSTPIFSILSAVSRNPAVSTKRNEMPSMVMVSSMKSRVVPLLFDFWERTQKIFK
jgi:hypothetical protein